MSRLSKLLIVFVLIIGIAPVAMAASPVASDDAVAEGAHDDEHAHDTSPPLVPEPDLVIWSLVAFGIFLFLLSKLAWNPLIQGLDDREAAQRQAAAETQHALTKAQDLLKEHEAKLATTQEDVKEIIAEARRDAERTSQDIVAAAQAEAETTRNRAVEEIGRAKDVALKELFDGMAGQVTGATEHVLGRALNDSDQDRLVADALSQVANS